MGRGLGPDLGPAFLGVGVYMLDSGILAALWGRVGLVGQFLLLPGLQVEWGFSVEIKVDLRPLWQRLCVRGSLGWQIWVSSESLPRSGPGTPQVRRAGRARLGKPRVW